MKTKRCKSCENRKRVYRQSGFGYFCERRYYCAERKEMIKTENGCERWQRKITGTDITKERFDEVEADLTYIAEYCAEFDKSQKENATIR